MINTILLGTKEKADEVLDFLKATLKVNNLVTLENLYNACGISTSVDDSKYGWVDISEFHVVESPLIIKDVNVGLHYRLDIPLPRHLV